MDNESRFHWEKSDICLEKKKNVQRVSPEKKNSCTSSEQKKKYVRAENSPNRSLTNTKLVPTS